MPGTSTSQNFNFNVLILILISCTISVPPPVISLRPPRIILSIQLLPLAIARSVHPARRNGIRDAERDSGAAHDSPDREELRPEPRSLPPPEREQRVSAARGGGDAGAVDLEALQVRVAGEEEDGHEQEGEGLRGTHVQGRDEGREARGGERRVTPCF